MADLIEGNKRGDPCTICQGMDGTSKPRRKLLEPAAERREAVIILYLSSSNWHLGRHTWNLSQDTSWHLMRNHGSLLACGGWWAGVDIPVRQCPEPCEEDSSEVPGLRRTAEHTVICTFDMRWRCRDKRTSFLPTNIFSQFWYLPTELKEFS